MFIEVWLGMQKIDKLAALYIHRRSRFLCETDIILNDKDFEENTPNWAFPFRSS
jgi:hypothetical protein